MLSIPTSFPSPTRVLIIQGTSSFTLCSAASDAIDGVDNPTFDNAVEVDLQDSSEPNPLSDPDDEVSSDDDDVSKDLLSELLQSSPVPAFNPL